MTSSSRDLFYILRQLMFFYFLFILSKTVRPQDMGIGFACKKGVKTASPNQDKKLKKAFF